MFPADYAVRAIPLAAGRHLVGLEYAPSGFTIGKWVSAISAAIYLAVAAASYWRWKSRAERQALTN